MGILDRYMHHGFSYGFLTEGSYFQSKKSLTLKMKTK